MGRGPGLSGNARMWFSALLVLATFINETSQISKNFVNSSMPELRPTFVVNFDMSTVICQHSSDPSDLHLHEMSILCDGKDDCFTNPAMHDESFPYCERKCNSTCNNRGACLYDGQKPQCYCNSGFSGAMCEIVDKNECLDRPCHLMAHCQNTPGAYECKCFPGFTGDGHQCFDIDECYENTKICPDNSRCVNLPGTFYCNCTEGFQQKGESLQAKCVDVNECESGLHNCGENQMCENTIGGFTCVAKCSKGYEFVKNECVDINECRLENTCDPRAECTNTPGGYECACEPGMSGDGKNCQPLTDCSQREDICDRHALCLPALKMCYCRSGYAGDGITCHDINECEAMENPCESQGDKRCVNVDGGYICCDNEKEDQRCIQEQGAFCSGGCGLHAYCANATCQCLPGYIGDPQKKCLDVDECESDKMCPGVGQWCVNSLGGFLCCGPDSKEIECQGAHIFKTHDGATAILHTNSSANEQWAQRGETVQTAQGGQIVIGQGVLRANGSIPSISIQSKLPCTSYCPSNSECLSGFCECLKGFGGNPHFGCEDIDECALGTSACPEDSEHWCVNTEGSFTCCNMNSTQTDCQGIEISVNNGLRLTGNNREGETIFAASLNESTHGEVVNEEIRVHNVTQGGHIILVRTKETSNINGENGLELNGHGDSLNNGSIQSRTTIGGTDETTALPELTVTLPNIVSTLGGHTETTTSIPINQIPVHKNELKIELDNSGSAVIMKNDVEGSGQGSIEDGDMLKDKNGSDGTGAPAKVETSTEPGHITVRITTAEGDESEKTGLEIVPDQGPSDVSVTDVHVRGPLKEDELKSVLANGTTGTTERDSSIGSETAETSTGAGGLESGGSFKNGSGSIVVLANGTGPLPTELAPTGGITLSAGNITIPTVPSGAEGKLSEAGKTNSGTASGPDGHKTGTGEEKFGLGPNGKAGETPKTDGESGKPKDDGRKVVASGGSFNRTTGGIVSTIVGNGSIPTGTILIPGHILVNGTLVPFSPTSANGTSGLEGSGTPESNKPTGVETTEGSGEGPKPTGATDAAATAPDGKPKHGTDGKTTLLVQEPTGPGTVTGVDHLVASQIPGAQIGTENQPKITSGGSFNQTSGGLLVTSGGNVTLPNGITLSAGNITIPGSILPKPEKSGEPKSPTDGIEIKTNGSSGILETGSGGLLNKTETTVIFKPVEPTGQTDVTRAGSNELGLEITGHPSSTTSGEVGLEISFTGSTKIPPTEQPTEGSATVPKTGDREPNTKIDEGSGENEVTTKKPSTDVHDGTEVESKEVDEGHENKSTTSKPNTDIHEGEGTESENVNQGIGKGSTTVGPASEFTTANPEATTPKGTVVKIISSAEEKPKTETEGGALTKVVTGDHGQDFIKILPTTTTAATTVESTTEETTQETGLEIIAEHKTTPAGTFESSTPKSQRSSVTSTESSSDKTTVIGSTESSTKAQESLTKPASSSTATLEKTPEPDVEGSGESNLKNEGVATTEKPATTQETAAETGLEIIGETTISGKTVENTTSGKIVESTTSAEEVTVSTETGSSGSTFEISSGSVTASTPSGSTEEVTGETGLEIIGRTTVASNGPTAATKYTTQGSTSLGTTVSTTKATETASSSVTSGSTTPQSRREPVTSNATEVTTNGSSSAIPSVTTEPTTTDGPFVSGLEIVGTTTQIPTGSTAKVDSTEQVSTNSGTTVSTTEATEIVSSSVTPDSSTPESEKQVVTPKVTGTPNEGISSASPTVFTEPTTTDGPFVSGLEIVGTTTSIPTVPTAKIDSTSQGSTSSGATVSTTEAASSSVTPSSETPENVKEAVTTKVTGIPSEATSTTSPIVSTEPTTTDGPFVSGLEIIGRTEPTTAPGVTVSKSNHTIAIDESEGSGEATVDGTTAKPETATEDLILSGGRTTASPNGTVESTTGKSSGATSISTKAPSEVQNGISITPTIAVTTSGPTTTEHPNPTGSTPNFGKIDETTKSPSAEVTTAPGSNETEDTTPNPSGVTGSTGTTPVSGITGASDKTNKTLEVTETTTTGASTLSSTGTVSVKNNTSTVSSVTVDGTGSTTSASITETTALNKKDNSTSESATDSTTPSATTATKGSSSTGSVESTTSLSNGTKAPTTESSATSAPSSTATPSETATSTTSESSVNGTQPSETIAVTDRSYNKSGVTTSSPASGNEATTVKSVDVTSEPTSVTTAKPTDESSTKVTSSSSKAVEISTSPSGPTIVAPGVTETSNKVTEATTSPSLSSTATVTSGTSSSTASSVLTSGAPTGATGSPSDATPGSTVKPVTAGGSIELATSPTTGAKTSTQFGIVSSTEPTDSEMTPKTEIDDGEDVTKKPLDSAVTKQNRKPTDFATEPPLQVTTLEETSSPLTATLSTKDTFALPSSSTVEPETLAPGNTTKCRSGDECGDDAQCERRTGACRCYPGFEGAPPQKPCQDVDECAEGLHNCHPSSRCHNFVGGYACFCPMGYRKNDKGICEDINECAESRGACCSANGTCVNKEGSYGCECKSGFAGDGYLCLPLEKRTCNESEQKTASCEKNHICMVDGQSKTDCDTCNMGYKMVEGKCIDINECSEAHLNMCDKNANCNNLMGTYGCECKEGFRGDGFMCEDIDECLRSPCHPQAECNNAPGSFNCTCPEGFIGDGIKDCTNPLERSCEDVEKFCGRTNHTACLSVRVFDGSLTSVCECEPNYRLNPDTNECEDIDECGENRHNCDPSSSHCVNQDGGFKCECSEGYEGRGGICVDVDECERGLAGCHANAMCLNQPGSCGCKCRKGFTGDGIQCNSMTPEPVDNSCTLEWQRLCRLENKTCHIDEEDVPQCGSCIDGHHPLNGSCQPQQGTGNCADPSKNNCDVNAECIDVQPGRHFCSCKVGYIGDGMRCDDIDECSLAGICDPNAACKNLEGSFECSCLPGYLGNGFKCIKEPGPNCHLDTKLCHSNAFCATDGSCKCKEGLEGDGINNCTNASSSTTVSAKDLIIVKPETTTGPVGPTNPTQSRQNQTGKPTGTNTITTTTQQPLNGNTIITTETPLSNRNLTEDNSLSTTHQPFTDSHSKVTDQQTSHQSTTKHLTEKVTTTTESNNNTGDTNVSTTTEGPNDSNITNSNSTTSPNTSASIKSEGSESTVSTSAEPITDRATKSGKNSNSTTLTPSTSGSTQFVSVSTTVSSSVKPTTESTTTITKDSNSTTSATTSASTKSERSESTIQTSAEPITESATNSGKDSDSTTVTSSTSGSTKSSFESTTVSSSVKPTTESTTTITKDSNSTTSAITLALTKSEGSESTIQTSAEPITESATNSGKDYDSTTVTPSTSGSTKSSSESTTVSSSVKPTTESTTTITKDSKLTTDAPITSVSTKSVGTESTVLSSAEPITDTTPKSGNDFDSTTVTPSTSGSTKSSSESTTVSLSVEPTTESTTTITKDSNSTTSATTLASTKSEGSESTIKTSAEPITDSATNSGKDYDSTTVTPSTSGSTKSSSESTTVSSSVKPTTESTTTITKDSNSTTSATTSASTKSKGSESTIQTSAEPITDSATNSGKDSDLTTVTPSTSGSTKSSSESTTVSSSVEPTTESTTSITKDSKLTTDAPITSVSTKSVGTESTVLSSAEPITDTTPKSGNDFDSTTVTPSTSGSTKSLSESSTVSLSVEPTTESTTTINNNSKSTTEAPITSASTKSEGSESTVSTSVEPITDTTTKSGKDSDSTTVTPSTSGSTKSSSESTTVSSSVKPTTESTTTITKDSNSTTSATTWASTKSEGSESTISTSAEPITDSATKSGNDFDSTILTRSTPGSTKSSSKSSTVTLSVEPTTESTTTINNNSNSTTLTPSTSGSTKSISESSTVSLSVEHTTESTTTITKDSKLTTEAPITSASTKSGGSESTVSTNAEPNTDTTTKSGNISDSTTLTSSTIGSTKSLSKSSTVTLSVEPTTESTTTIINASKSTTEAPITSGSTKSISESSTVSLSVEHTTESTTTITKDSKLTSEAPITSASTKSGGSESTVSTNAEPNTYTTTKSGNNSDSTTLTSSTIGSTKFLSKSSTVILSVEPTTESTTTIINASKSTTEAPITSALTKTGESENTVSTSAEPITDTRTTSGNNSDSTTVTPSTSGSLKSSSESSTVNWSNEHTTESTTMITNDSNSTTEVPITSASTKTGGSKNTVSTNAEPITDTTKKSGNDFDPTTSIPSTPGFTNSVSVSSTVSLNVEPTTESTTTITDDSKSITEAPITSASTKTSGSDSTVSTSAEPITDTTTTSGDNSDSTTLTPSTSGSSKSSSESSTVSLSNEHTTESTTTITNDSNLTTKAPITSASTKTGGSENTVSTNAEPLTDTTKKSGNDFDPTTDTTTKSANTGDINSSTEVSNTASTKSATGKNILSPTGKSIVSKTDDVGVTSSIKTTSTSTTQMFTTTNVAENTVSITRTPAARENMISKSSQTQPTTTESGKNTSKITALSSSLTNFSVTEANTTPMHATIIPVTKDALLIPTTKLLVLHLTSTTAATTNTNAIFTKNTSTSQTISDLASVGPPSMTPPSFDTSSEITSAPEMYTSAPEQFSTSKNEPKEENSTQGTSTDNPTTHNSAQNQTALDTKLTPASSTRIAVLPSTSTIFEDDAPDVIHATREPVHLITDQVTKFMQAQFQTSSENPSSNAIENTTSKKQFSASLHRTHSNPEETGTTKIISSDSETTAGGTEDTTERTMKFPTTPNIPLIDHNFHRSILTKNPSTQSNKTHSDTEQRGTTKVISLDSETTSSGTEATTDTTLKFPTKPNIPLIDREFHRSIPTKSPSTQSNKTDSDTEQRGTTKVISLNSETTSSGIEATTGNILNFPTKPNIPSIDHDFHRSIPTKNPLTLSNETHSDTEERGTTKVISLDSETTSSGTKATTDTILNFPTKPNIPSIDHEFYRSIPTENPSTLSNETHSDTEAMGTTKVISLDSETTSSGTEATSDTILNFPTKPSIPSIDSDLHRLVPTKNPSTSNETHTDTEETGTTHAISSDSTENGELVISHKEMTVVSLPTAAPRMQDIMGVEIKQQTVQSTTNMVNKQTNPPFDRTSVMPINEENWTSLKSNKNEVVTTTPVSVVKNIDRITDSGPLTNGNEIPLTNDGELVISHTNMMVVATLKSTTRMEDVMGLEIMHETTENTTDALLTSISSFTAVETSKVPLTNNEVTEFMEATSAPTESNATPHNPMKVTSSVTGTSDFDDFINNTAESATASNIQKNNMTELISSTTTTMESQTKMRNEDDGFTTTIVINEATLSNTISQNFTANPQSEDTNATSSETMLTTVTESASKTITTPNFKTSSKTALEGKTGFHTDKALESSTEPIVANKDVTQISSKTTQKIEMLTSHNTMLETETTSMPIGPVTDIDISVENSTFTKDDIAVHKLSTFPNNPLASITSTTVRPTDSNFKPVVTEKDTTPTGLNTTQQITESTSTATVSEVAIKTTIRFEIATDSSISPMVSQTTDLPKVTVTDIDVAVEDSTTSKTDIAANTISTTANTPVAASTFLSDNPTKSSARPIVTNSDTTPTSSKTQQVGKSTSLTTMSKISARTTSGWKLATHSSAESLSHGTTSLPKDPVTDIDIAVEKSTTSKVSIAPVTVSTIANSSIASSTDKPTESSTEPVVTFADTKPTNLKTSQEVTTSASAATIPEISARTTVGLETATDSSIESFSPDTTGLPKDTVTDIDIAVEESTTSKVDIAAVTVSTVANTWIASSSDKPTESSTEPFVTFSDTKPTSLKTFQEVTTSASAATIPEISARTTVGLKTATDSSIESFSPETTGSPKDTVTDIDIAVGESTTSKVDIAAVTVSTISNTSIFSATDKPTGSSTEEDVTFADTKPTSLKTSQEVTTSASVATIPEISARTTVGLETVTDSSAKSVSPETTGLPKDTVTDIVISVEESTTSKVSIAPVTVSTVANTLIVSSSDKPTESSTEEDVTFADTKPTSLKTSQEVTTSASVATIPEISARTTVGLETATDSSVKSVSPKTTGLPKDTVTDIDISVEESTTSKVGIAAVTVSTVANTLIASSSDKPTESSTEPVVTFSDTKPTSLKTSQEVTTSASAATMPENNARTTVGLETTTNSSVESLPPGTTGLPKDTVTDIDIAVEESTTSKVDIAANTASTIANTLIASSTSSTEKPTRSSTKPIVTNAETTPTSLNTSQQVTTSASSASMPEISAGTTVRFERTTDSRISPMFSKETDLPESNSINLKTSQTTVSTSFESKVGFQTTSTLKTSTDSSFGSMLSKHPGIPENSLTDIGTPIDQNTTQKSNNAANESSLTVTSSTTLHTDGTTESSAKPSFTSTDSSSISSELAEEFTKLTSSANILEVEESTTIGVEPVTSNSVKLMLSGTTSATNSPVTDSKTTFTAVVSPTTASKTSSQPNIITEEEKTISESDTIVSTSKPATQQRAMFSRMSTLPTRTPTEITQGDNFSTPKVGTTVSSVSLQTTTTKIQNKQETSTLSHQAPNSSEVTSVTSITPKSDKQNTEGTQQETSVTVSLNSSLPTLKIILGRTSTTEVGSTTNKPLNRLPSTLTEISSTEKTTATDQPINSQRLTTNSDITFGAASKLAQTTTNGLNDKVTESDVVSTTTELAEKTTVNSVKSSSKPSTHDKMLSNKKTTTSTNQDSSTSTQQFEEFTQASFRPQPTSESSKLDNILVITTKHADLHEITPKPEIEEKQSTTLPIDRTTSMNVPQNPVTVTIQNQMIIAPEQNITPESGSFPKEPENREIMWPDIIDMENPSEPGPPSAIPNPDEVDVFIDGKAVKPETPFDEGATSQKQLVPKVTTDIIAGKPVTTGKPVFEIPDEEDIHSENIPRDSITDSHPKIPTTVPSPTPAPINLTPSQTGRTFFRPFQLDTNFTRTTHAPIRMRTTPARTNQHHRTRNPRVFGPGPKTKHRTPSPRVHWRPPTTTTTIAPAPAKLDPSDYEVPYFAAGNIETTAKPTTTAPEDDGIEVNNGVKPEKDTGKAGRCSEDDRSACHEFALCEVRSGLCRCKNGFEGDGFTSCTRVQTIDCVTNSTVCHENAVCDRHSRHCACSMGYIGDGILCSPDPQDCVIRKDLCSPDALCTGRRCRCREGFTGDGVKCVSIHQRSANCSECDINAHCDHGVCTCNVGYFGNGLCCVPDPRDCVLSPGVCHPEAHCNEKQRKCECSKGYLGDGISCFPQLSCRTDPSVCHKDAICLPSGQCICRHGYEGNGHHCTTIQRNPIAYRQSATANDAPVSQCANSCDQETQLCIEGACVCKHGFEEKDGKCVDIDECLAKPCHHLAFCHNQPGAYNCICPEGYVGDGKSCVQQINIGDLGVICEHDGMTLILSNSTEMFEGRMFVRGQAENPHCSKSFSSLQQQPKPYTFKVPFEHCNVRLEKDDTFATTVIVQKHPMFITTQAEAYDLKCAFPTGTKEVNSHVNVSEPATTSTLSDQADGPLCQLTVVDEKQENVNSATVGQFLRLRLEVSPNNTYSILPRNCFAINIETGDRYSLTDRAGCTIDEELFPEWTRITPGMTEATFRTFKWPDSSMIRFQCDCNACVGPCPNVDCRARRESAAKRFRFRRARHAANETAEAVAEMNFVDEEEKKLENKVVDPKRIAFSTLVTVHADEEERRAQNEVERWTHGFSTEPEMQPSIAKTESVCIRTTAIVASAILVLLCLGFLATNWIGRLRKTKEVTVTDEPISVISY